MATKALRARPAAAMAAAVLLGLVGCGSSLPPFVQAVKAFQPDERPETSITTVEVCYNRATTSPEAVKKLAEEICDKKGTHATFVEHRVMRCPLLQPASANFECR